MRRKILAVDSTIIGDERLSDAELRLLLSMSANYGTKMFQVNENTLQKLKISKRTFYRQVVNLVKLQYLQHDPKSSSYSVSVSILAQHSAKSGIIECQGCHLEEEKESEKKRTKRKDKEKEEYIYNNIYIDSDSNSLLGDTDKVKSKFIDTSVEQNEKKPRRSAEYHEIICYLNEKAGKRFSEKTRDTQRHISARLDEGFTVEDFKTVIDKKIREWKGTEMEKYLRPETLFSEKFDRYLNESNIIRKDEKGWDYRVDAPEDPLGDEIWSGRAIGK